MATLRDNAVPVGGVNDMSAVFEQPQAEALVYRDVETDQALITNAITTVISDPSLICP